VIPQERNMKQLQEIIQHGSAITEITNVAVKKLKKIRHKFFLELYLSG
jgi:hypothetical protein